jgi:phosphatidylglycerol---prolipoprotein diacylglyceryl transferase
MVLNYIAWNPDPVMFQLGSLSVRWYSVLLAAGFFSGYLVARDMFRREGVDRFVLESYGIWLIIGILVGGRLGHCLFYEFDYYMQHPIEMIKPWEGTLGKNAVFTGLSGFSSHGWIIGVILALWINSRLKRVPVLWALDIFAIGGVLAGAFVRIGNLVNSEIVGNPSGVPWAFVFPNLDNLPRHPAQLYESAAYVLIFIFTYLYYRKKKHTVPNGTYFGWVLIYVFASRFVIEFFKRDQVAVEAGMVLNLGQWLSIPFMITGIFLIFRKKLFSHSH